MSAVAAVSAEPKGARALPAEQWQLSTFKDLFSTAIARAFCRFWARVVAATLPGPLSPPAPAGERE
jgi:hypothetical protein